MLVSLRMSCWLPGLIDREITEAIAQQHNVRASRAGRYQKYTIDPKTPSYLAVRRALGELRTRFYWHTLPWAHRGVRILPAVSFAQYSDEMRKGSQQFIDCVESFCNEWPRLKTLALAETHGLVKPEDFPANVRDRFGVELQVMPIPTVGDFRVAMADEDAARLKAQMQEGVDAQIREALVLATREPYERLYELVKNMCQRLADPDGKFHDTLITNVRDLCAVMPALNITGDANLQQVTALAEKMIANIEPQQLRDVPILRERVAVDAAALKVMLEPHVAESAPTATQADEVRVKAADIEATMGAFLGYLGGAKP